MRALLRIRHAKILSNLIQNTIDNNLEILYTCIINNQERLML